MFGKAFDFLVSVAINGFLAIFIAAIFYIILAFVFVFAMIPVLIIAGDGVAQKTMDFAVGDLGYKVVYAIVFISMMMDDLGVPNGQVQLHPRVLEKGVPRPVELELHVPDERRHPIGVVAIHAPGESDEPLQVPAALHDTNLGIGNGHAFLARCHGVTQSPLPAGNGYRMPGTAGHASSASGPSHPTSAAAAARDHQRDTRCNVTGACRGRQAPPRIA